MDISTPTPPTATPPPAPPPLDEAVSNDPLDALLKQIIGGWFILTDGQGAVSKWAEPAEILFGREAPAARARARGGQRAPRADRHAVPARGGLRPGQARRGLRLLPVPRGSVVRAADEPDAAAHAPAAPGRRARAARRARRRAAAVGRLAHGRHDGRLPPARADPVGRAGADPA